MPKQPYINTFEDPALKKATVKEIKNTSPANGDIKGVKTTSNLKNSKITKSVTEKSTVNADVTTTITNTDVERIVKTPDGTVIVVSTDKDVYVNTYEDVSEQKYISSVTGNCLSVGSMTGTTYTDVVNNVCKLGFDVDSGFSVTDLGSGLAKIGMNSTFKFWQVDGLQGLVACGIDTVNFIQGSNISITADNNTTPKTFTISSTAGGVNLDSYCSLAIGGGLSSSIGNDNFAIGKNSLLCNTTGNNNIGIGGYSLSNNTYGVNNIAVGNNSLCSNVSGGCNVVIGICSMSNTGPNGYGNIVLGNCNLNYGGNYNNNVIIGNNISGNVFGTNNLICIGAGYGNYLKICNGSYIYSNGNTYIPWGYAQGPYCPGGVVYGITSGCCNQYTVNACKQANIGLGYYGGSVYWRSGVSYVAKCNIALGFCSAGLMGWGCQNIAIGTGAMAEDKCGSSNIAIGNCALRHCGNYNLGNCYNIGVGQETLYCNVWGGFNTALGNFSLRNIKCGCWNVAVGTCAGQCVSPGTNYNTLIGFKAGLCAYGGAAVAIGANALIFGGLDAVAIGRGALGDPYGCSGVHNHTYATAIGAGAGSGLAMGRSSVLIGYQAGYGYPSGKCLEDVIAIGNRVMHCAGGGKLTGSIAIGAYSAWCLAGWPDCFSAANTPSIAIGSYGLKCTTTGQENIAIGRMTMCSNTIGSTNIAIGNCSMANTNCGGSNVAIGVYALRGGGSGALMHCNTAIGTYAGCTTYGCNNIIIGYCAQGPSSFANNTITLGNSGISCIRAQVTVISSLSDIRDKTDVEDIPLGLEFIMNLRPVKFTWNMRDGAKVGVQDSGFIAQEVADLEDRYGVTYWLDMVGRENPEKLELKPGKLIPILVKAVQELSSEVSALKNEIMVLKAGQR